jgi:hypothetical protein
MPALEPANQDRPANSEDVRRALGEVEDHVIAEILSLRPSLGDLTHAALWFRGDGDLEARGARPMTAPAQAIVEVLIRLREQDLEGDAR